MSVSTGDRQYLTADDTTNPTKWVGPIRISLRGGFGGGTATIQDKSPANVFDGFADSAFTAETDKIIDYPVAEINEVQVDLTGSTTPTLEVWIQGKRLK